MEIINNYNYPILNYIGSPTIIGHKSFRGIYQEIDTSRMTEQEKQELLNDIPDNSTKELYLKGSGQLIGLIQNPTQKRLEKWPIMAVNEDMFREIKDTEKFLYLMDVFNTYWFTDFSKVTPEIANRKFWDEMYFRGPDEFDGWLEDLVKKGCNMSGIIIYPEQDITRLFVINYEKEYAYEMSFVFRKNKLISFHHNYSGFLDDKIYNIQRNPQLQKIATIRNVTIQEAFFQEEMYNVLKYLYFKETYRMVPKELHKGDNIYGNGQLKYYSDAPCVIFEKPLTN